MGCRRNSSGSGTTPPFTAFLVAALTSKQARSHNPHGRHKLFRQFRRLPPEIDGGEEFLQYDLPRLHDRQSTPKSEAMPFDFFSFLLPNGAEADRAIPLRVTCINPMVDPFMFFYATCQQ